MFANAEISNFDKNEITLEPRLVEYLRKKKLYKQNNIHSISLEREFSITNSDIAKIKNYLAGKKIKTNEFHTDMINPESKNFESENLQQDARLLKIKQKQQRDREAIDQRNNYDNINKKYDMYRNDRQFASAYGNDLKSNFNPNVWLNENVNDDGSDFEDSNPNRIQINNMQKRYSNQQNRTNKPAKIRYQDYMAYGCNEDLTSNNYSLDNIISKIGNYSENVERNYKYNEESDINLNLQNSNKNKNKREKENNYRNIPHMNGSKLKDINIENYLCYGSTPSRGAKSLGYPNPVEHYFSYISDDISKPEHTVFEPGIPSRLYNKDTAKVYKNREVM